MFSRLWPTSSTSSFLSGPMPPLTVTQVQTALGHFAEALAGRPVRIEATEGESWPWHLGLPEPLTVTVPAEAPPLGSFEDQRRLYRAQVIHQIALTEFGTFGRDPQAPNRCACIEHHTITSSPFAPVAAGIAVLLEHARVVSAAIRRYPGASDDLERAMALGRQALLVELPPSAGLVAALRLRCLGADRQTLEGACPGAADDLEWMNSLISELEQPDAGLDDSARVAVELARRLTGSEPVDLSDDSGDTPSGTDAVASESDGDGGGSADEIEIGDADGSGVDDADPEGAESPDDADASPNGPATSGPLSLADEVADLAEAAFVGSEAAQGSDDEHARTYFYDEWNHTDKVYLPAWCRLVERQVEGRDQSFAPGVRRQHRDLGRRIRQQLSLLRPDDRVRVPRSNDGEELDFDAVVELIVDRRSGVATDDDRLDIRRDASNREVATALLVDLSASTSSPVVEPTPPPALDGEDSWDFLLDPRALDRRVLDLAPRRRILDVAKDAVVLLCDALDELGDRYAVYGFSGHGRHDVEFHVTKNFEKPSSPSDGAALAALEPIRYTRMGPAIRHAASKLAAQEARTRLLLVISDGHPQDIDYGPERGDKAYGIADTAKAIEEARRLGVDAYCVTIDPAGSDYLGSMFSADRYLVIDEIESLPAELAKLYLTIQAN